LNKNRWKYLFKDVSPRVFAAMRQLSGISKEAYLNALHPENFLSSLKSQQFSDGKSGSFFCFSPDKNFIIKTIEQEEAHLLKRQLPNFLRHFATNPKSLINRLYGLHALKIQNLKIYVLVMGNLFNTSKKIHEKYDLKFSWVKRSVKGHSVDPSILGKDKNLKRKMKLEQKQKDELTLQVESDVLFLTGQGIMDYSLLLGFHFIGRDNVLPPSTASLNGEGEDEIKISMRELKEKSRETTSISKLKLENPGIVSADGKEIYFVGLIDILQTYNFNKQMERWFKIYCLHADKAGLSVQPVQVYCNRFLRGLPGIME